MQRIEISPAARVWTALLSLVLCLPVAAIPFQNTDTLQKFHNRTLVSWPLAETFQQEPVKYFKQVSAFLSDRAFPIVTATIIQKNILYYALWTPPQRRVTLGLHGYVFLNGASENNLNALFRNTCVVGHSDATVVSLRASFASLRKYGSRAAREMYFVIVPMKPTLYADYLPYSVPFDLRRACLAGLSESAALVRLAEQADTHLTYPLLAMMKSRTDKGFFPMANYHPIGMSLKVIRDAFLDANRLRIPRDESLEPGYGLSEILSGYGIDKRYPLYIFHQPSITAQSKDAEILADAIKGLFIGPPLLNIYRNRDPQAKGRTLMLSDSVGIAGSPVFAAGFEQLTWIYTNGMDQSRIGELIDRAAKAQPFDSIIMMTNEGGSGRFGEWAKALATRAPSAP